METTASIGQGPRLLEALMQQEPAKRRKLGRISFDRLTFGTRLHTTVGRGRPTCSTVVHINASKAKGETQNSNGRD